jgi:signal transduction histidine kinase
MSQSTMAQLATVQRRHARLGRVHPARPGDVPRRLGGDLIRSEGDDPGIAAWRRCGCTPATASRRSNIDHRLRLDVFFVGLLVLASILMLRQPLFFIFGDRGLLLRRSSPAAARGRRHRGQLDPRQHAHRRRAPDRGAWTFYLAIIGVQTVAISAGAVFGEKVTEQSEERRQALARLEAALEENAGLHAQLLTQAREAGILDERQRMAREIHDTIAQGLTGIITQLEAANQAVDRPADRDRHLANAELLARESLTEARRSVEASMPAALESLAAGVPPRKSANRTVGPQRDPDRHPGHRRGHRPPPRHRGRAPADGPGGARTSPRTPAPPRQPTLLHGRVVTLDVRDDGVGFAAPEAGGSVGPAGWCGLTGMRQRVARGGSLAIESEPGGGRRCRPGPGDRRRGRPARTT